MALPNIRFPSASYPGPPLIGLTEAGLAPLPYAEHAHRVEVRWDPVHTYRQRADGSQEPVWRGVPRRAYRAVFTFGWDYLPADDAAELVDLLLSGGAVWFAPYSEAGAPVPQAFRVNVVSEVPDFDDLVTLRRPITVELHDVDVYALGPEAATPSPYAPPPGTGGGSPTDGPATLPPGDPESPLLEATVDTSRYDRVTGTGIEVGFTWAPPLDSKGRTLSGWRLSFATPGTILSDAEDYGLPIRSITLTSGPGAYRVAVRALYTDGTASPLRTAEVVVAEPYGAGVRNLRALDKGPDWLHLQWDPHPDRSGGYVIGWTKVPGAPYELQFSVPNVIEARVEPIAPGRWYFAVRTAGSTVWSNEIVAFIEGVDERYALVAGDTFTGEVVHQAPATFESEAFLNGPAGPTHYTSGSEGWRVTPDGRADFRQISADEMKVKAFTADVSQALVGSSILSKSRAVLAREFRVPVPRGFVPQPNPPA